MAIFSCSLFNTIIFHFIMNFLTVWIYAIGLQSTGILSYMQHFMSDNVMPWHDADIVCPNLFNPGTGVVHLAGNLTSDPEQIQVLRTLKNQESFWLDGIRYHLGCNEMSCEYLRVQHRIGAKELKAICIKKSAFGDGLEIESNCNKVYNLTSIADQSNLHTLSEYVNGEELRINQVDIKGILKECRLATRTPNGFRIKYQNCAATHKVLCQKHSKATSIVTTLVYQRTANAVDTEENVYVRMTSTVTEAYDTKGVWDTKWLITTCLSGLSCTSSVIICIYLCYRVGMKRAKDKGDITILGNFRTLAHQESHGTQTVVRPDNDSNDSQQRRQYEDPVTLAGD